MMQPIKSSKTVLATRSAWEPPAVTKLPIGAQTKSAVTSGSGQSQLAEPQPPAAPATKLGFSFEMAFPLSARLNE
jgi:hypothetical protein